MTIRKIFSGKKEIEFDMEGRLLEPVASQPKIAGNGPIDALADPICSPSLEDLADRASSIAIIIPDATRAWQKVSLMAEAVRNAIKDGRGKVDWVIAGGQHRFPTNGEVSLLLGSAGKEGDEVHFHDPELTVDTGRVTSRGNKVTLHRTVLDAELVVMIGGIAYHELAGFSGGRKTLIPGVSGRSSIVMNHSMCLDGERVSSLIGCGRLEGNPVHEDMVEYAHFALEGKTAFLLNVVPDERGTPWRYVAGDPFAAWRKGVEVAAGLQTLTVEERADWVVVSSGGYPYDIDLYQATKSVTAVMDGLKPGGAIVMVAGLEDGMGPGNYGKSLEVSMKDPSMTLEGLKKGFTIPSFCAFKLVQDLSEHPALLVTSAKNISFPGKICSNMDEAITFLRDEHFLEGRGIVLPAGNCVVLKSR